MKQILFFLMLAALALTACAPQAEPSPSPAADFSSGPVLTVSIGEQETAYTPTDLEALGAVEVQEGDIVFVGVLLKTLLADAGIDPSTLLAVKAVALDGFSSNFDPSLFLADTTLVAYKRADGPLTDEESPFRIVAPGQGGKMNPRMLSSLIAIQ